GTLGVWKAGDALVEWQLALPCMEQVRSLNAVGGETNDGFRNDIRSRPLRPEHVQPALATASCTNGQEGANGAVTRTVAFGWKGGIGTSSRKVDAGGASYTVGVLVQSNYGGTLVIDGVEVGPRLPDPSTVAEGGDAPVSVGDGSIMMVVA